MRPFQDASDVSDASEATDADPPDGHLKARIESALKTIGDEAVKSLLADLEESMHELAGENNRLRSTGRQSVHEINSYLQGVAAMLEVLERQSRGHEAIAGNIKLLEQAFGKIRDSVLRFRSQLI